MPSGGGGFGTALAVVGDRLLVGAPNLGTDGATDAHAYLFDPATGALARELVLPVGHDRWWQFSVGAAGTQPFIGITPGDEDDGLGGSVTLFDGATGAVLRTIDGFGGIAADVGTRLAIGGPGGAGVFDALGGGLERTLVIADPDRRGVLALTAIGTRTLALAAARPVGVHLFDVVSGTKVGFVGTRHGDTRRFGSAMAVRGSTLAVAEIPQVNVFDVAFGAYLGTIDPPSGTGAAFGTALAYAGSRLVVGAPSAGDGGAIHVFDAAGNHETSLSADGAGAGFGRALAALGRSIAVGIPAANDGAVVLYAPCGDGVVDPPVEQCDGEPDCDADCRRVEPGVVCGDADGDGEPTLRDGVQLLRAAADLPSVCALARCDVDGNGAIGLGDAVQVLRAAADLPMLGTCGR